MLSQIFILSAGHQINFMTEKPANTKELKPRASNKHLPPLVLLDYKQSPVLDPVALDRAFDILFEEVLKSREKVINNEVRHI